MGMSYCQGSGCSQNPGIAKNFLGAWGGARGGGGSRHCPDLLDEANLE